MKLGTDDVKFALGSDEVDKICLGIEEVWTNFVPFYVVNNGVLVDGNYSSASRYGSGTHSGYNLDYGFYGITATDDAKTGATITFNTKGAKTLRISADEYFSTSQRVVTLRVTGNNDVLYTSNQEGAINVTVDVSGNDLINVDYYAIGGHGHQGNRIITLYCGK